MKEKLTLTKRRAESLKCGELLARSRGCSASIHCSVITEIRFSETGSIGVCCDGSRVPIGLQVGDYVFIKETGNE